MSILVCQGSETPQANNCTAQTSLSPVYVQVAGPVFGELPPDLFAGLTVGVACVFAVLAALRNFDDIFK